MQQYKCLIIEDEPLAAEVLQDYIAQVPSLQLAGICGDAVYAMDFLKKEEVDLIFLDIHLPKIKGLEFLKMLKKIPNVIITTAYHEYAMQGYEYSVTDYLLKPIEFSRFLAAINKLRPPDVISNVTVLPIAAERKAIFFSVSKKKVRVFVDDILYIESLREYVRIVTKEKSLVTKVPLNQVEDMLAGPAFIRIHRSFIISKAKVDAFTTTDVEIAGKQIPIGRNYKEGVMTSFGSADL